MSAQIYTDIRPGCRAAIQVPICTLLSGVLAHMTVHVLRGREEEGPTLVLLSSSHGAEFLSIEQIRTVITSTDPDALRGTLLACAVANPLALEQFRVTTPSDEINMNRVYPGTPPKRLTEKYAGGVTEYMAHLVTTHLLDQCDVLLDFHLGPYGQAIECIDIPTQVDSPRQEKLRELACLFNVTMHEWELFPGSAVGYVCQQGKLGLGVEIGGGGFGNAQSARWVAQAADGVRKCMQHLGMLKGRPEWPQAIRVVTSRAGIRPRQGGYHVPDVGVEGIGTVIESGCMLGRTYNTQTFELVEELHSPYRGVLYMVRSYGPVHPGEWAYVVGEERGTRLYRPRKG